MVWQRRRRLLHNLLVGYLPVVDAAGEVGHLEASVGQHLGGAGTALAAAAIHCHGFATVEPRPGHVDEVVGLHVDVLRAVEVAVEILGRRAHVDELHPWPGDEGLKLVDAQGGEVEVARARAQQHA